MAALRWLLASLFWGRAFPLEPGLLEAGLTFAWLPADRLAAGAAAAPAGGGAACSRRLTAPAASRRRALVLGGAQLALLRRAGGRLYQLQVQRSAEYALLAEDNRPTSAC